MTHASPARLLIVDDEAVLLRSLCQTLQDQGYETTGFSSAREALAKLREQSFDLLLADLAMPEMDGITLLREALQVDRMLVGVIMTGEGTISTAVEAMRSGAYDYVLKPFKMAAILPVLQRGLAMRALRVENAELEGRLRERATELEAANRELEAFTRSASHDLRAPLAGVLGLCTLLDMQAKAAMSPQAASWLEQIETEGRRMLTLLDDLMRLSQIGRQVLELQPVDVSALARDVVRELREREPGRTLEVRIGQMHPVDADVSLLRQVFVNLLSNAFKFTRGQEHPIIDVGDQAIGGEVAFHVRDNGVGFDMEHAAKLFSAFQRLHSQKEFEGSGVGLTIAQRVVQRHGGRIWVEAARDAGACFYFTLAGGDNGHSR
jgi:signal transduction histidine kinase